jgi:hypothetical protein
MPRSPSETWNSVLTTESPSSCDSYHPRARSSRDPQRALDSPLHRREDDMPNYIRRLVRVLASVSILSLALVYSPRLRPTPMRCGRRPRPSPRTAAWIRCRAQAPGFASPSTAITRFSPTTGPLGHRLRRSTRTEMFSRCPVRVPPSALLSTTMATPSPTTDPRGPRPRKLTESSTWHRCHAPAPPSVPPWTPKAMSSPLTAPHGRQTSSSTEPTH